MTFAIKPIARTDRRGFTLIELLVVMGIIALLIGILLPAASLVLRKANAARVRADLNTIATALDQYKSDFGSYPVVIGVNPVNGNPIQGTGAHVLCQALFGLGPAYPVSVTNWAGADGADGPGFRIRRTIDDTFHPHYVQTYTPPAPANPPFYWTLTAVPAGTIADGIPDSFGGKVSGPYLKPENFRFDTATPFSDFDRIRILDHTGGPILYYSASSNAVSLAGSGAPLIVWGFDPSLDPVATPNGKTGLVATANYRALYNSYDNSQDQDATPTAQLTGNQMLVMLGDYDCNNIINGTEPVSTAQPFLLWSRGADQQWGPKDIVANAASADANRLSVEKCDDITNFR